MTLRINVDDIEKLSKHQVAALKELNSEVPLVEENGVVIADSEITIRTPLGEGAAGQIQSCLNHGLTLTSVDGDEEPVLVWQISKIRLTKSYKQRHPGAAEDEAIAPEESEVEETATSRRR